MKSDRDFFLPNYCLGAALTDLRKCTIRSGRVCQCGVIWRVRVLESNKMTWLSTWYSLHESQQAECN